MISTHAALRRTRAAGVLALAAVALVSGFAAITGAAAQSSTAVASREVGRILNRAIERLEDQDYAGADRVLGQLDMSTLSPYERSRAEQILSKIANSAGDYEQARAHLQAALDSGGLNEQESSIARTQFANTYVLEERWAEGAAALEAVLENATDPDPFTCYVLAVAYYQMGEFSKALPPVEQAIELGERRAAEGGEPPQESWYRLAGALAIRAANEVSAAEQDAFAARPPILRILPIYPDTDRSGDCVVSFNLDDSGATIDVSAVCTDPVFQDAAEDAVKVWRYVALPDDNSGLPRRDVKATVSFARSDE